MLTSGGLPATLKIEVQPAGGVTVVRLAGELDAVQSNRLRSTLKELVQNRTAAVCVNMSGLSFINSAGIATLIECLQGMREYGGRLILSHMNQRVRSVFEVARLDMVFAIVGTEQEAMAALAGGASGREGAAS